MLEQMAAETTSSNEKNMVIFAWPFHGIRFWGCAGRRDVVDVGCVQCWWFWFGGARGFWHVVVVDTVDMRMKKKEIKRKRLYWTSNTRLQFGDVGVQIVVGDWNLEAFGQIAVAGWLKFAQQFGDCNSYANTLIMDRYCCKLHADDLECTLPPLLS